MAAVPAEEPKTHYKMCRVATGTYTGDGSASQSITGIGFTPKYIIIFYLADGSSRGMVYKTDDMPGSKGLIPNFAASQFSYKDDMVTIDADGFTVGDGTGWANVVNIDTAAYAYVCFG